jgi:hypothetical protein
MRDTDACPLAKRTDPPAVADVPPVTGKFENSSKDPRPFEKTSDLPEAPACVITTARQGSDSPMERQIMQKIDFILIRIFILVSLRFE